ncbi:TMV resistance protein N [Spatholobus suberectus]|nr:TMV resistance protein N [Spatholobus suberectus]
MQTCSGLVEPFEYDVFLCFRGLDTRYSFTGHLYKALRDRGFRTFIDEQKIEKGSQISKEIPKAIEKSRIFIIVLSKNFASSAYCLNEVVEILDDFPKGKGRWVLPVFFYVDPSDLADTYEQALADYKKRFNAKKIEKWRTALKKLPDFFNWRLIRDENIFEGQYIEHILKEVSRHVPCPIGLRGRISKVDLLLQSGLDRLCMIGICGKAGIGKTMVACGVYNFKANRGFESFDHYRFFDNLGDNLIKSGNVDQGMSILIGKKVFIIFEDIKNSKRLENISELAKQLGSGSKVIITAQGKGLLDRYGIKRIYEVERFSKGEALQLLSLKAFNSTHVSANYANILSRIESYALGNPRTLEVIGSNLSGKSTEKCDSLLLKYVSIENGDTQKILEESFNALEKCQLEMLIHIGLCLRELELVDVEAKLRNKYKVCPRIHIRVLLDKSLIKINLHGQVTLCPSTRYMIKDKVLLFKEHGKQEILCISTDGSMNWDPMELECQLPYQH